MPKSTFFNLSKKKRYRIIEAAMDEFASYSFSQASVARIIEKSSIASGSFYQYFDDKLDLYKYIISRFQEEKLQYLSPLLQDVEKKDFFKLYRQLFIQSVKFARENPGLQAIASQLYRDKELLAKQLKEVEPAALEFYRNLLEKGIASGCVRDDIDMEITSLFLFKLGAITSEYIMEKNSLKDWDMDIVDTMIDFIKKGIAQKGE
ncbi:MAG: TetR/AcrR family transcriptional regulator [Elusimicrobiota bacterium]